MTVKEQIEANKAEAQKRIATALRAIQVDDLFFARLDLRVAAKLISDCIILEAMPKKTTHRPLKSRSEMLL